MEKLRPFGDKLILAAIKAESEESVSMDTQKAKVVAVGLGMPYGRGEFYAPSAKEGMVVIVPMKVWTEADKFDWQGQQLRVVHERQCMTGIVDE